MNYIHIILYVFLVGIMLYCFCLNPKKQTRWLCFFRKHLMLLVLLLVFNTISFGVSLMNRQENYRINRQSYDGQEKVYSFKAKQGEKESEFTLSVEPKKLKPKEVEKRMAEAFQYYEENLKGDNESLSEIKTDLNTELPYDKFPFNVDIRPADFSLVDDAGDVRNEKKRLLDEGYSEIELLSGISTELSIVLSYGDVSNENTYKLVIFPEEKSEWDNQVDAVRKMFERKEQESLYDDGFELPASYDGMEISSLSTGGISPAGILFVGFVVTGLLLLKEIEDKKKKRMEREQQLLRAYPWFINEMVLLLGAGMQIKTIFAKLIQDYKRKEAGEGDYRAVLIEELKKAGYGFEIGMSEGKIYYELGRRIQLSCYIKVMTLLEQNATKGSKGLVAILEQEERSALEERVNLAKRRGEEAGTKILGPMVLLLLIIMLMIMIPAFLSFAQ